MPRPEFHDPGESFRCGGFSVEFETEEPRLMFLPGARQLPPGLVPAVLAGLSQAPEAMTCAVGLRAPPRPYEQVEVLLVEGALVQGEAFGLAGGTVRLRIGEQAAPDDIRRLALHEALHLLLATGLSAGDRWNDGELAFADWIVRGIEAFGDGRHPRFRAPLPALFDPLPASRLEVQQHLGSVAGAPAEAARLFGLSLFGELRRAAEDAASPATAQQAQLRLVESALGLHYLEAAARLGAADGFRAVLLDDWLLDYEQYARAVGNPPSGAGSLWRLSQAGWSADPLVRLAAAAQALQVNDRCWFSGTRLFRDAEPVVWRNRGRVRLPLLEAPARPRPAPIHGLRAALRELDAPEAMRLLEEAALGAEAFEARALWPRVLARLLAAGTPLPHTEPPELPRVQIVQGTGARAALASFSEARQSLAALWPELAPWLPLVDGPLSIDALLEAPRAPASLLLVHGEALDAQRLLGARRLAAHKPVRSACFFEVPGSEGPGVAALLERLPDLDAPLDPRYREECWAPGDLPERPAQLPALADRGTEGGRLSSPLCHLLAMLGPGLEECLYPRPPAE